MKRLLVFLLILGVVGCGTSPSPEPAPVETDADKAIGEYNKGVDLCDREDWATAIACFTKAIRLNPDYAEAYYNRGVAYSKKDELDKAIGDFSAIIDQKMGAVNPLPILDLVFHKPGVMAKAYYNRGIAYMDLGQYHKAVADYTEVLRIKPDDADAYFNRAAAYDHLEEHDKEIADYTEVIRIDPDNGITYYIRGLSCQELGDKDKAAADFAKAEELGYELPF
jgi:tetratricopeptide (TPR) repeat protein